MNPVLLWGANSLPPDDFYINVWLTNSYPSVLNEFLLFTRHESWHFRTFNTQHVQCYPEHSISTATVPSKSKSSHSTSMKALLNSTNFWAFRLHKMDCPPLLLFHISTPKWNCNWKQQTFSFTCSWTPRVVVFRIWHAFNQWLQNQQSSGTAAKHVSESTTTSRFDWTWHPLFDSKKLRAFFVVESAGVSIHLGTAWFCFGTAAMAFLPFQSARGSIFRSPKARFWLGTCSEAPCFCQGQVFFVKLASCIAVVLEVPEHASNSPIEGGIPNDSLMIALSNPTQQIEMMIGWWLESISWILFVCSKSFREKVFLCMSQAMIASSLARIQKKTLGGFFTAGHRQCSSQVEVNCRLDNYIGHLDLLGLRNHPCEACLWKANFADSGS